MKVRIYYKESIVGVFLLINILWFLLIINTEKEVSIIKEKNTFSPVINEYIDYLKNPAYFERDINYKTTQYYYIYSHEKLDEIVKEKLLKSKKTYFIPKRLIAQYLRIGDLYESQGMYIYARNYYRRGFEIAHYVASNRDLFHYVIFQRVFSELRLKYEFYENNFPIFSEKVNNSLFYDKESSCEIQSVLNTNRILSSSDPYYKYKKYGLALSITNNCYCYGLECGVKLVNILESIYVDIINLNDNDSHLKAESAYMAGEIKRKSQSYNEARHFYAYLLKKYPLSYLADDALFRVMQTDNDKGFIYQYAINELLTDYQERDAARNVEERKNY